MPYYPHRKGRQARTKGDIPMANQTHKLSIFELATLVLEGETLGVRMAAGAELRDRGCVGIPISQAARDILS